MSTHRETHTLKTIPVSLSRLVITPATGCQEKCWNKLFNMTLFGSLSLCVRNISSNQSTVTKTILNAPSLSLNRKNNHLYWPRVKSFLFSHWFYRYSLCAEIQNSFEWSLTSLISFLPMTDVLTFPLLVSLPVPCPPSSHPSHLPSHPPFPTPLPSHAVSLPPPPPYPTSSSPHCLCPPPSPEGRPFPDGALHPEAGAHHFDQRQRVGRGRLLLPALHGRHSPPGSDALRLRAPGDAHGGGEAGGRGGGGGGAQLYVPTQQAGRHPALDA